MSDYSDLILADGGADLVGYYRMGDVDLTNGAQLTDSSGNARHGIMRPITVGVEPATFSATGAIAGDADTCIHFNHSSAGGAIVYTGGHNLLSQALDGSGVVTVEFWMKRDGTGVTVIYPLSFFGNNGGSPVETFSLSNHATNGFTFNARSVVTESVLQLSNLGGAIGTTWWRHIVAIANIAGDTMSLYMDGVLLQTASKAFTNATFTYSAPLSEGNSTTGGADRIGYFTTNQHYVDEVAVYKKALTATQIGEHYAIGLQYKIEAQKHSRSVQGYYSVRHLGI
jgi:Concanavalin A-like lectin/glucanases superfamily